MFREPSPACWLTLLLAMAACARAEVLVATGTFALAPPLYSADCNFHPQGLGFDEATGELLYMQQCTNTIYRTDQSGNIVGTRVIGPITYEPGGAMDGSANHTTSVAADAGNYYFSDYTANASGYDVYSLQRASGPAAAISAEVSAVGGYPIDVRGGMLYRTNVSTTYDWSNLNQVRVSDLAAPDAILQTLTLAGVAGIGDIAIDLDGDNIWVIEYSGSSAIKQYDRLNGTLKDSFPLALDGMTAGLTYGQGQLFHYDWNYPASATLRVYDVQRGASVRAVSTPVSQVGRGGTGYPVTVDIEGTGANPINVASVTLRFTGLADRTGEYTVTPDPGNPTVIQPMSTATFQFSVDVSVAASIETITLDASFAGTDSVTGDPVADLYADVTDTWELVEGVLVRIVNAAPSSVARGGTGYVVLTVAQNVGVNPVDVTAFAFTFTGVADRTGEYTVVPDPSNPPTLAPGAIEAFFFSVSVAAGATLEFVSIDAGFTGFDTVAMVPIVDPDADIPDGWTVVAGCGTTLCGDCSGDGVLSIVDALLAAQHAAGLITLAGTSFTNCNVTGLLQPAAGATVDILDALSVAQFAAGLPVVMVCC